MSTYIFKKGMRVKYIPPHLLLSFIDVMIDPLKVRYHKDCRTGVVSRVYGGFVYVKYDPVIGTFKGPENEVKIYSEFKTGDEPCYAQATKPEELVIL